MAKKEVKQATPAAKVQSPAVKAQLPKMAFDAWWAMTQKKLPQHHHKEVVMADFMARGLSTQESMATFNKALEQYGVKSN